MINKIVECENVRVDEYFQNIPKTHFEYEFDIQDKEQEDKKEDTRQNMTSTTKKSRYVQINPSKNYTIGDGNRGVFTISRVSQEKVFLCLLSKIEPKYMEGECNDNTWVSIMKEELDQN